MNSEHYRLEALKMSIDIYKFNVEKFEVNKDTDKGIAEIADVYYSYFMQDKVKAEEEAKKAELPQYKIPPNQAV